MPGSPERRRELPRTEPRNQLDRAAAIAELMRVAPVATELARLFVAKGFELALVGGSVRDALLGRLGEDLDLATSARPEQTLALLAPWADATWKTGMAFGTVGAAKGPFRLEITTYRSDSYDRVSRKPDVEYGDSLEGDLLRRDFTVNALAVTLPEPCLVDPYGGLADLASGVLRTPGIPEQSFADDPLRLLRLVRFSAQLGFGVDPAVTAAASEMHAELGRITSERVQQELTKLMLSERPAEGVAMMTDIGLAGVVLPEVPALRMAEDEHGRHKDVYAHTLQVLRQAIDLQRSRGMEPDLVLRLAALLHDVGKPTTRRTEPGGRVTFHHHEVVGSKLARRRLTALRYSKEVVADVSRLVYLHLRFYGYRRGEWTDSAVRRYVTDAGPLLSRLHILVRSDCTTRNTRRAAALASAYDALEERIDRLREQEDLDSIRPDLDGNEIMRLLGLPPGPDVGRAWRHLREVRMERGPLDHSEAVAELRLWAEGQLKQRAQ